LVIEFNFKSSASEPSFIILLHMPVGRLCDWGRVAANWLRCTEWSEHLLMLCAIPFVNAGFLPRSTIGQWCRCSLCQSPFCVYGSAQSTRGMQYCLVNKKVSWFVSSTLYANVTRCRGLTSQAEMSLTN